MNAKDSLRYFELITETLEEIEQRRKENPETEGKHPYDRALTLARCRDLVNSLPPWVLQCHTMLVQWFKNIYASPNNAATNMLDFIDTAWLIQERMNKNNPGDSVPRAIPR